MPNKSEDADADDDNGEEEPAVTAVDDDAEREVKDGVTVVAQSTGETAVKQASLISNDERAEEDADGDNMGDENDTTVRATSASCSSEEAMVVVGRS